MTTVEEQEFHHKNMALCVSLGQLAESLLEERELEHSHKSPELTHRMFMTGLILCVLQKRKSFCAHFYPHLLG